MDEIKPIKRSKQLAPLSREHHDGLLFSWKLKQGLVNGTSIETLVKYSLWYWTTHIRSHFSNEERALIKFLPADDLLVQQMLKEHTRIRDLILSLEKEADANSIQILADVIHNNIRFEERKLFEYAEKALTPEQLDEIHQELPDSLYCDTDIIANEWKDEFWVKR